MPEVVIDSNLNYAEVKPVYKEALGSGADGLSVEEPDRRPNVTFNFVTQEAKKGDDVSIPSVIEIYTEEEGDIAVFDPVGRENQVYRRTDEGSYEQHLREIITISEHMSL